MTTTEPRAPARQADETAPAAGATSHGGSPWP